VKILHLVKENWILILSIIIIALFFSINYIKGGFLHAFVHSDIDTLIAQVQNFGNLAAIVFIFLVIIEVVLAPLPSFVLYAIGGVVFGTFWGGTLTLLGNVIGAIIAFKLAQSYLRNWVEKNTKEKTLKKWDTYAEKYGGYALFVLRINPLTSSDLFNYIAGLTKMPMKHLILGTAFGLAPLAYIQTKIADKFIADNPLLYLFLLFIAVVYVVVVVAQIVRKKS